MYVKYLLKLENEDGTVEEQEFILTPATLTLFEVLMASGWEVAETLEERNG
ncbi:hypothetical protein [Ammoniphilus sp. YIM 78166]|uniref:hypothetical protein n=1 Tax=Ammoniphilus sp. YIM 78166 TaxID=1644106 RepID=UPI0014308F91|nr:hypothetical protein [Ammoniphilus sp. YIM 78166]